MIQNFEKQIGDEDYDYRYLRNNCINSKDSIKSYFNGKEETFYKQILPFIIDQALLIEERGGQDNFKIYLKIISREKSKKWDGDRTPTTIVIPSATQEEVLFCVRPELYAAMFICQRVYENEIIIISNAYKIMDNTRYLNII